MKNILMAAFLLTLHASCKKDVDELPAATQTGAHTFGARVNGELWIPQGFGVAPTAPVLEGRFTDGGASVVINARNFGSSPTETEFEIYLKDISSAGVFLLNNSTSKYPSQTASYAYFIKRKFTPEAEYITGPQRGGQVTVTRFDKANNIISGTFSFEANNITDPAAGYLSVTDARFDIKIQ